MTSEQPSADVAVRAAASHSRVLRPEPRLLGRHTLSLRLGSTMAPTSSDENSKSDTDLQFRVELRGFEPLTPSMRTRCATGLRYSPENLSQPSKRSTVPAHRRSPPPPAPDDSGARWRHDGHHPARRPRRRPRWCRWSPRRSGSCWRAGTSPRLPWSAWMSPITPGCASGTRDHHRADR
jgi:hypothetical protein